MCLQTLIDSSTFRRIYDAEASFVWNFLRRLGVAERDIDDKVHDVFVVVHRKYGDYDAARPIRAWIAGICVRVAADYRRMAYQQYEVLNDETHDAATTTAGPDAQLEEKQMREFVMQTLERMDPDRREVFVLHEIEGYSMPEIATIIDAPLNTLYSRLRLAREAFRSAIHRLHGARKVA